MRGSDRLGRQVHISGASPFSEETGLVIVDPNLRLEAVNLLWCHFTVHGE
jgi:hypothetical protein